MKKLAKILALAAACVAAAAMAVGFAACGGSSATRTGLYVSTDNLSWTNMTAYGYNYYFATFTGQTLELYDDDSYVLTQTAITFSNLNLYVDTPTGSETGNDQGQTITIYHGTYEVTDSDSMSMTVQLAQPTRVEMLISGNTPLDSDTVKEGDTIISMTVTYDAKEYFDQYLSVIPESGIEVFIYTSTCNFDYIDLEPELNYDLSNY